MYIDVFKMEGIHNRHQLQVVESVGEGWQVFYSVDLLQDFLVAG